MKPFTELDRISAIAKELLKNTKGSHYCRERRELEFAVCNPWHDEEDIICVIKLIAKDGYDITGFGLDDIPIDGGYIFYNPTTHQAFDVYYLDDLEEPCWSFMYMSEWVGDCNTFPAKSIQEAIEKYIVE